jgi:hypothetical protein
MKAAGLAPSPRPSRRPRTNWNGPARRYDASRCTAIHDLFERLEQGGGSPCNTWPSYVKRGREPVGNQVTLGALAKFERETDRFWKVTNRYVVAQERLAQAKPEARRAATRELRAAEWALDAFLLDDDGDDEQRIGIGSGCPSHLGR